MGRPAHPTLAALAVAGALALAACLVALMASQEAAEASFPGENGRIAFGADGEIYTMLPDGSDRRQLTTLDTGYAAYPAWSSDGTKIAFNIAQQGSFEIYTMNADGSGRRQLTPTDGVPSNQPVLSPDGNKIAFWSYHHNPNGTNNADIFVMNADGSGIRRLTTHPDTDVAPAWSPGGTEIAFNRENGEKRTSDIWVMNAFDGTGQVNLTPNIAASFARDPDWSPDGNKIAFSGETGVSPNSEIYTMNASGSSPVALTNTPEVIESEPVWAPDGTEIAFKAGDRKGGTNDIWRMQADGTHISNITNTLAWILEHSPDWQPLPKPTAPQTKADCKKGGYKEFGYKEFGFKNQGKCIAFVNRAASTR